MKNDSMNQMNQMNLLQGNWYIKKYFFFLGRFLAVIWVHSGSFERFSMAFGFITINISKLLVVWMYQMYVDEPLVTFKRFFYFDVFSFAGDEPWGWVNLHSGSFGSLRMEV